MKMFWPQGIDIKRERLPWARIGYGLWNNVVTILVRQERNRSQENLGKDLELHARERGQTF